MQSVYVCNILKKNEKPDKFIAYFPLLAAHTVISSFSKTLNLSILIGNTNKQIINLNLNRVVNTVANDQSIFILFSPKIRAAIH